MPLTRINLANRALDKLFMVGSGQSPDPEDTLKVDGVIDSFAEFLSMTEVYTIADFEDIDVAAYEPLAMYLAWFCASDFKKPQDENMRAAAERMLTLLTATRPSREMLTVDYF